MAITLIDQLPFVRRELSDLPEDYATDEIVYQSTEQAYALIQKVITVDDFDDVYISHCTVTLSAYYVYLDYTSLAERQLGTLPPTVLIRLRELKRKARSFINTIANDQLDEDLSIDMSLLTIAPIAIGITDSSADGYID